MLDKNLINLTNKTLKVFEEQKKIALEQINKLPDSEIEKKTKFKELLLRAGSKDIDPNVLMKELTDIANGR